jgi:putative FmdB family regulatory protein
MPFYEYQCKNCGHDLEAMQKVNDPPLKKCPECGKSQLTRLMSAPVFRLKGAGWYETDFKGDQDNKKNLADRPEAEAAKDEAKPAADAKAGDGAAKDAPAKEASGKDAPAKETAKSADKAADKPVKAVPTESSKKTVGGAMSKRGASVSARPAPKKAAPKKALRKPAPKARRRG